MKTGILGFVLGIIFCLCLASTTDLTVFRPAKPSATIVKTMDVAPGDKTPVQQYVTDMSLKGYQITDIAMSQYYITIVMCKY